MIGCATQQTRPCEQSKIEVYCSQPISPKLELLDDNKPYYEESNVKKLMSALDSLEIYAEGLLSTIKCYEEATTKKEEKK